MPQELDKDERDFLAEIWRTTLAVVPLNKAVPVETTEVDEAAILAQATRDLQDDLYSLQRLYALALDRIATLEKTLTAAQHESTRQLDEIRMLRRGHK